MKISQLFERYRHEYLEYAAISPERAVYAWKHLGPVFGRMDAERLSAGSVARYQAARQASSGTINRELGVLAATLRWGAEQGYISVVPHISKMRSPPPRQRVLDEVEIARLLEAAKPWPHVLLFIKLGLLTGQRKEAILNLKWEQISGNTIDFRHSDAGLADRCKGRAVLPVSSELRQILEEASSHFRLREIPLRPKQPLDDLPTEGWVISPAPGRRYRSFRRAWTKVVEAAGLADSGVTPHTLRHTAATRLISAGASLTETARFLGHRSTRTTEEVYVKFSPAYLERAVGLVSLEGN